MFIYNFVYCIPKTLIGILFKTGTKYNIKYILFTDIIDFISCIANNVNLS